LQWSPPHETRLNESSVWVEEHQLLSVSEFGGRQGLMVSQLHEFIDQRVLQPVPGVARMGGSRIDQLSLVRTAAGWQDELEPDPLRSMSSSTYRSGCGHWKAN